MSLSLKTLKNPLQLLLILALSVSLCNSQAVNAGNQLLSQTDITNDPLITPLIALGLQTISTAASQAGACTDCKFNLTAIRSAYRQCTSTSLYTFNCDFKNAANFNLSTNFVVLYDPITPAINVVSFTYTISVSGSSNTQVSTSSTSATTTTNLGSSNSLTQSQFYQVSTQQAQSDSIIKSCLNYGAQQAIQQGSSNGQLSGSSYSLSQVQSVYAQSTSTGTNYQFTCLLSNQGQNQIQTTFTVAYNAQSGQNSFQKSTYSSQTTSSVSSSLSSTTTTSSSVSVAAVANTTTTSSSAATTSTAPTNLVLVSTASAASNSAIQNAQSWGSQQVIQKGISQGKIPNNSYTVSQIITIAQQTSNRGTYYQFNLLMVSTNGIQLTLKYTVLQSSSNQQYSLNSWSFAVKKLYTGSGVGNGNYVDLTPEGIQGSPAIQAAINWGIEQVIQKGVSQGKIPQATYAITQLGTISQSIGPNGNSYKCNVLLANADGAQLVMNYTVSFKVSTQSYSLTTYSFRITGIKVGGSGSSGYNQVPGNQFYNTEIQGCLNYGVQQLVKNYQVYTTTKINSVFKLTQSGAVYYKFDITLSSSSQYGLSLQLTMIICYQAQLSTYSVSSYSWKSSGKTSVQTTNSNNYCKQINNNQITSNQVYNSVLQYGVNQCLQNLQSNNIITLSYFSISKIVKAFTQVVSGSITNYQFQVELSDSTTTKVTVWFTVQYNSGSNQKTLVSYSSSTQSISTSVSVSTSTVASYSASSSSAVQVQSCQSVAQSQWTSSNVQSIVQYGMQQVISKLSQISTFSSFKSTSFSVSNIQSITQSSYDSSVYNVQATFKSASGTSVDCNYQVSAPSSGQKALNTYTYTCY